MRRLKISPHYRLFLTTLAVWQVYFLIPLSIGVFPYVGILLNMAFYTIILITLRRFARSRGRPDLGSLRPQRDKGWRLRALLGVALGLLSNLIARIVSFLLFRAPLTPYVPPANPQAILTYTIHITSSIILYAIVSVSEEGIFRGYIMDELLKRHGYIKSLLISSLLFAVYHINLIQPIITLNPLSFLSQFSTTTGPFLFGLAAGYLYKATNQNLTAPIAYHFTFNLFRAII